MQNEDLRKWFKEKWVNIGKKDKSGKHPPCGTSGKKSGYAKCVPSAKAARMSKKEKASATLSKRAAQNKAGRGGKNSPGQGKKPIGYPTVVSNRFGKTPWEGLRPRSSTSSLPGAPMMKWDRSGQGFRCNQCIAHVL